MKNNYNFKGWRGKHIDMPSRKFMRILGPVNKINAVAVSGGIDSIGALTFLTNGGHRPKVLHFQHGTEHAVEAFKFVQEHCYENNLTLITKEIEGSKPKDQSWEEWWRNERYKFLENFSGTIATAHTLNDCAETWLMGAINGRPKLIPYRRNNIVRPFLLVEKNQFKNYVSKSVEDPGNRDLKYDRTKIRNMMHSVLSVNPGYLTVIAKKVRAKYEQESKSSPGKISGRINQDASCG